MKNIYLVLLLVLLTWSANAQNKSLQFNGANNKVVVPHHDDFDFTTSFTLEAWIYADEWKDQAWQGSIINKDGDYDGAQRGFNMRSGANGRLEGIVTPGWEGAITAAVMKTEKWNHVAEVYKEGEMWLYINGTLQAYKAGLPNPINPSPFDLLIGECPGFTGRVWDGRIDEVRIWNIARNGDEIQQNMNAELTGSEEGLIAYYNFDEDDAATTLTDLTGNGHDGALENYDTPTWTSGYELSENDIAVVGIVNPGNSPQWSSAERLKIEVKNMAFNAVSGFDVSIACNGDVFTETIEESIEPWQTYQYTFNKFLDLSESDEVTVKAYVSWASDSDAENDTLEMSFVKSNTITLMDAVQHNFGDQGQLHSNYITLPDDNSMYDTLLMHISVDCPTYGCDPWDQMGNVKIKKDGYEYEIGRFITPYGKACGPWTIDVTDFRSILSGSVEVITFIQVWGSSGWLLNVDLEFKEGEVEKPFTQILPLYELERQVYGDPDISYDLDMQTISVPGNTQTAHVRMTNTGHGQGNTSNAAEFMETNHHLWVNGNEEFTHHLWKDDCDENSCSPQSGTWQYARAGWCPGQEVIPVWFDLAELLTPGEDMHFDYILQEYTNTNNTGYNDGSHTEPFYRIYSYLQLASDEPFGDFVDLAIIDLTVDEPVKGDRMINVTIANNGNVAVSDAKLMYTLANGDAVVANDAVSVAAGETADLQIAVSVDEAVNTYAVVYVDAANDQIASNDAQGTLILGGNSIYNQSGKLISEVYPNPTTGKLYVEVPGEGKNVKLLLTDISGKGIMNTQFNSNTSIDLSTLQSGLYLVQLRSELGTAVHKIELK